MISEIVLANAKKVHYLMSDMFEIYKCIFKKINVNSNDLLISKSARIATKKIQLEMAVVLVSSPLFTIFNSKLIFSQIKLMECAKLHKILLVHSPLFRIAFQEL